MAPGRKKKKLPSFGSKRLIDLQGEKEKDREKQKERDEKKSQKRKKEKFVEVEPTGLHFLDEQIKFQKEQNLIKERHVEYQHRYLERQASVEREKRKDKDKKTTRKSREEETRDKGEKRREKDNETTRKSREEETRDKEEKRREKDKETTRKSREEETRDKEEKRREKDKETTRKSREEETRDKEEKRREKDKETTRKSREEETRDKEEKRREKDKETTRKSREAEPPAKKLKRLARDKKQHKDRRSGVHLPANQLNKLREEDRTQRALRRAWEKLGKFSRPDLGIDTSEGKASKDDASGLFHLKQAKLERVLCPHCSECDIDIVLKGGKDEQKRCERCNRSRNSEYANKFTEANMMHCDKPVPEVLSRLTQTEEILISPLISMLSVYHLPKGQLGYSGHVITFPQAVGDVAKVLPRLPADCKTIVFRKQGSGGSHKDFFVRRHAVSDALYWMKDNNPHYKNIHIDKGNLEKLPVGGEVEFPVFDIGVFDLEEEEEYDDEVGPGEDEDAALVEAGDLEEIDLGDGFGVDDGVELLQESTLPTIQQLKTVKELKGDDLDALLQKEPFPYPAISSDPVDEFHAQDFMTRAFPTLFPYGDFDFYDERSIPVQFPEFVRHLMRYKDQRFARHPRFRYFALNILLRHRAMECGNMFVKKNPELSKMSLDQLTGLSRQEREDFLRGVLRFGHSLPGTPSYWYKRRQDLVQMIKQHGIPTLFVTLSAADLQWPDLHQLMPGYSSKAAAVNENPLICDAFFVQRVKDLLSTVFTKDELDLAEYWFRVEFQHRGSPHVHGLIWIRGAPDILSMDLQDPEAKRKVIEYFESLLTCTNPGLDVDGKGRDNIPHFDVNPASTPYFKVEDPELDYQGLVSCCHTHTCKMGYCKKTADDNCRFGFPKNLRLETVLEPVKDEKTGEPIRDEKTGQIKAFELMLKRNDGYVNCHNRVLATTNRSNTDAQAIVDLQKVISYVVKYVTKAEPKSAFLNTLIDSVVSKSGLAPEDRIRRIAQRILIKSVGDRDYSSQETIHCLMAHPYYLSSRSFYRVYLHGGDPERLLRRIGDEICAEDGPIERYMTRPTHEKQGIPLADVSLGVFYRKYNTTDDGRGGVYVSTRRKDAVVVPMGLRKASKGDPEYARYCTNYLMLHKPFKNYSDLKEGFESFEDAFESFAGPSEEKVADFDDAIANRDMRPVDLDQSSERRDADVAPLSRQVDYAGLLEIDPNFEIPEPSSQFSWNDTYQQNCEAYDDADGWIDRNRGNQTPAQAAKGNIDIGQLNEKQRSAYDIVVGHFQSLEAGDLPAPLRHIITGTAGTGKSLLIRCLVARLGSNVLVVGPTGICASNVNGQTVHSAFKIGIRNFHDLNDGSALEKIQEQWGEIRYIILEEMSMVGLKLFHMMDRRLSQIFPKSQKGGSHFGDRSVIMFGDFGQLAPPCDTKLFRFPTKRTDMDMAIAGRAAYKLFRSCTILDEVVRQEGVENLRFREILSNVRIGEYKEEDYRELEKRMIKNVSADEQRQFKDAIRIFATNEAVDKFNAEKLAALREPVAKIKAVSSPAVAAKASYEDCGLESSVSICVGAKIMLTANLNIPLGLCNGAIGTVRDIVYKNGRPPDLPLFVLCEFPGYKGPGFQGQDHVFPIFRLNIPVTRRFNFQGLDCRRTGIPLRLAWAITIHKSQGLTLERAVIDIGLKEFSNGLTFVALSRVRTLKGLLLHDFGRSRLKALSEVAKPKGKKKGVKGRHRLYHLRQELERLRKMEKGEPCELLTSQSQENKESQSLNSPKAHSEDLSSTSESLNSSQEDNPFPPTSNVTFTLYGQQVRNQNQELGHIPIETNPQLQDRASDGVECPLSGSRFRLPRLEFRKKAADEDAFQFHAMTEPARVRLHRHFQELVAHFLQVDPTTSIPFRIDQYGPSKTLTCKREGPKVVVGMKCDGHCWYHGISQAVTGYDNHHMQLRKLMAAFIESKKNDPQYEELYNWIDSQFPDEIRRGDYAEPSVFLWMAAMLGVNICVYYPTIPQDDAGKTYQWVNFAPVKHVTEDVNATLYFYFCGVDLMPYLNPNHFAVVMEV